MRKILLVAFLSLFSVVFARETHEIIVFKNIVIMDIKTSNTQIFNDQTVHFIDVDLSNPDKEALTKILTKKFIGTPIDGESIQELKQEITAYYISINRPFVLVNFPSQKISDGVVCVYIEESHLSKVKIKGNKHFKDKYYEEAIRVQPGDALSTDILGADIAWINRNPFRRAEIIYKPGEEEGTTDVDIVIRDRIPIKVFAGTNNTGFKETGYQRLFAGAYFGNLFNLDQLLSYQYTQDYHFKRFQSHTFFYEIPFPWRHLLVFFGGLSYVDAKVAIHNMSTKGKSYQASTRYVIPFFQGTTIPQEARFGINWRQTNNTLVFGGNTISSQSVNIFQFIGEYRLSTSYPWANYDFSAEAIASPGRVMHHMKRSLYSSLRTNTSAYYFYLRSAVRQLYKLPNKMSVRADFLGQATTKKLLPSEQFGLGGYDSVRAYKERAVNADNAVLLRTELRSIPVKFIPKKDNAIIFYAFSDFGVGWNVLKTNATDQFKMSQILWGIGPGLNYYFEDKISLRVDWGGQLSKVQGDHSGRNRVNFGAMISF